MIKQLEQRLAGYRPWQLTEDQTVRGQAGVIMLLTDSPEPSVVLTQRASKLSSHAGEVAFPGGKRDLSDPDLLYTALREAEEEIGVAPGDVRVLGSLSQILSKHRLAVTPFVGVIPADVQLRANPDEIDSIFYTPIDFLLDLDNARLDNFVMVTGKTRYVPSWNYQGYEIWGLTAWAIAELLNIGLDAGIPTRTRPERVAT